MGKVFRRTVCVGTLCVAVGFCLCPAAARAQPPSASEASPEGTDRGPTTADSNVGYIDDAIPGNQIRLRIDAAYDNHRPTRAEFFYARNAPFGPGLPLPETGIDYQDVSIYLEHTLTPQFSAFIETGTRFLNPEVNDNAAGLMDSNAGLKWAFAYSADRVATLQFKTYFPTGDASRGLGTHHYSLEPGLLFYQRLDDRLALEGELRYWIPVGGTEAFAGDVVRYGVGLHYDLLRTCDVRVSPVIELVGWTVVNGQELVLHPSGLTEVRDADGDTIVNAKLGVRFGLSDRGDVYVGYGRALTGDRWYEDIYRLEFRLLY